MNEKELIPRVRAAIERRPGDVGAYGDLFELCRNLEETDFAAAHETNLQLRRDVVRMIRGGGSSIRADCPYLANQDKLLGHPADLHLQGVPFYLA